MIEQQVFKFILILACCGSAVADLQTGDDARTPGFQSDLWQMEFQKEEKQPKERKDGQDDENDGRPKLTAGDLAQEMKGNLQLPEVVPGQVQLSDLSGQTPFENWHLEAVASGEGTEFLDQQASAKTLSEARVSDGPASKSLTPKANGPTIVTLLVAVIACIVLVGAFFSGR
ncbi:MAG: hypothetical protein R3C49_24480 [Planctomycetaceae bacterium]